MLATGDSEMQVLDDDLASDLSGAGGVTVTSDARQSTAISSPFFFNWPGHALGQVADHHPDIVAMFLGGNEGFRLGSAECCGADWSREYAARVAGMMRTYRQAGVAAVYWFLIPTPSKEPFVKVVRAVNRGIVSAAAQFPEGVHFFDLRPTFSPGGHYINSLTHDGQTITVHESDGFHLSESADRIVARMFIAQLRRDGVLP
ncbi:MAG: GDSL-type esterase/lipase family protein [Solirubrobacterales bacterium]